MFYFPPRFPLWGGGLLAIVLGVGALRQVVVYTIGGHNDTSRWHGYCPKVAVIASRWCSIVIHCSFVRHKG